MKPDEIWDELKRRRVVRVALAYAAALFLVLQVADLTFEPLGLPEVAFRILLMVGLVCFPVAVALAWAFDVTPEGVKAADSVDGVGSRRLGPAVIGVAVVVAAGVGYWQFWGGPEPVGAEGIDPELIAVVPFRISSPDERVAILREGVIDMLAPVFSRVPRIVDSGAMISAWRVFIDGDESMELSERQAVELARRLGAGRALVGSVVGSAESFVLNARLLSVPDGELIGDASVDGSADGLREALSQFAGQVLSMEAGVDQGQIDYLSDVPLGALEAYLEGRQAYRRTAWVEARTAFSRALDADSTFALAALGAREAVQMGLDADRAGLGSRANRLLRDHLDRLPPRWFSDGEPDARQGRSVVRLWRPALSRRLAGWRAGLAGPCAGGIRAGQGTRPGAHHRR
jgi:serine/threonine-protein kinase